MDPAAEGKMYPEVAFSVDPARVAAFRGVVEGVGGAGGDAGRAGGAGAGVPPTFATAAEFALFPAVIADPELGLDLTRVVHGSQEYVYERPLVEGETLTGRMRIASIRQRGGSGFLALVTELRDADGALVCTARSQMIERGDVTT
ncbi:MAG TPA: MaoC family dehydratase N-terminal domain-containing protein [Actinomycetota bacterium]